jgi:hypothetical protein
LLDREVPLLLLLELELEQKSGLGSGTWVIKFWGKGLAFHFFQIENCFATLRLNDSAAQKLTKLV